MQGLLVVWFLASLVAEFSAEPLNKIQFGGFKLGFGLRSRFHLCIVVLIFLYVRLMNNLTVSLE